MDCDGRTGHGESYHESHVIGPRPIFNHRVIVRDFFTFSIVIATWPSGGAQCRAD